MDPASWEKAKDVITEALKRSPAEREAFVRERCPDPVLRAEVDTLLRHYQETSDFLEQSPHPDEPSEFSDLQPGTHVGPYVIVDRLGRGGMGQVFLGSDPRLHRKVALKCLISSRLSDDDRRPKILSEARAAARINHPNVATVHDVLEHGSRAFMVMEYVEGESLAVCLKRERLSIDRVLAIGRQLASALAAAHDTGIVHGDLKPANVQLRPDGSVKVLDFGVAKARALLSSSSARTTTAARVETRATQGGTPGYMSPEQLLGREIDERSDIFSFGVILYEMATGRPPFSKTDPLDLVVTLAKRPRADADDPRVSRDLADLIAKALEVDARERFQTATELEARLMQIGTVAKPHREFNARHWVGLAVAVLVATYLIWLTFIALQSRSRAPHSPLVKTIRSVAVLPLVDLSKDPEQDYFVDGMTDGLINALGRVGALKVTARTSVMPFKGTTKSVSEIAAALGVDAVIEGSATLARQPKGSDRVRVTVNLIDPSSQTQMWNDTIERDIVDVLSIQYEIARALAADINLAVTPEERARLGTGAKMDPQAYKLFLLGRQQWTIRTQTSLKQALEYFRQAIGKDPNYAAAYAGLADTYVLLAGDFGAMARDVGATEATANASQALTLDPTLGEAYASLAFTNFFMKWDWLRAEQQFKVSLSLNPSYATAHQWFGDYLSAMGREDAALAEFKRALELDPLSPIISRDVAWPLFFSRKYDEAVQQLEATLAQHPGYVQAERLLARAYVQKGAYAEALRRFRWIAAKDGLTRSHCDLAWAYARAGRPTDAVRELNVASGITSSAVYPYDLAFVFTALHRYDDAFSALNRAFGERDPTMVNLKHDPRFDDLRSDPRFAKMLALMRFPS